MSAKTFLLQECANVKGLLAQTLRYEYGVDVLRGTFGTTTPTSLWYYSDALGSVTALSNASGALQTAYGYNAWGEVSIGSDWGGAGAPLNNHNAIGYTGQFFDSETGLMPLGNGERYYSASLGRFTQQDAFSGRLGEVGSLNRYSYGFNNPLMFVDPSGNDGVVADTLKEKSQDPGGNYWWNFTKAFVTGFAYDTANFASGGTLGMVDVAVQDAMNGRGVDPLSAWRRGGVGATQEQVASNLMSYGGGVAQGVWNTAKAIPQIGYGLATHPINTVQAIGRGLGEQLLGVYDTVTDPGLALDRMAAAGQDKVLGGIGEFVGEIAAFEGAGAVAGRAASAAGRALAETSVGRAVIESGAGRAVAASYAEAAGRIGAARTALREFEGQALQRLNPLNYTVEGLGSTGGNIKYRGSKPKLYENQLELFRDGELSIADDLGVKPLKVGDEAFDALINSDHPIKWAINEEGQLLFIPSEVAGREIYHTALTRGKPVLAAGEANIVALGDGKYIVTHLTNKSGHFQPKPSSLKLAKRAFNQNGLKVDNSVVEVFKPKR